eukprot:TRINITY_DN9419_c0_g1_i1.p1 TRINITY_DN9419_c0_g1~~TRINITY_DN9419_c0_g1_i1.p1  ORF type:complete len:525 (-),score=97.49 TRINITY_DN9419_c0_g1_i1:368-1942(-)
MQEEGNGRSMRSLEGENELGHFLRLARPEWSCRKRVGQNNIAKVIEKLRHIGVCDVPTLVERIDTNSVNDQLVAAGFVPFGRDAIEGIRKKSPFIRALPAMDTPHIRQMGKYASVPQMLSSTRITGNVLAGASSSASSGSKGPKEKFSRSTGALGTFTSGLSSTGSSPRRGPLAGGASHSSLLDSQDELPFDCGGELRLRNLPAGKRRKRPPRGTVCMPASFGPGNEFGLRGEDDAPSSVISSQGLKGVASGLQLTPLTDFAKTAPAASLREAAAASLRAITEGEPTNAMAASRPRRLLPFSASAPSLDDARLGSVGSLGSSGDVSGSGKLERESSQALALRKAHSAQFSASGALSSTGTWGKDTGSSLNGTGGLAAALQMPRVGTPTTEEIECMISEGRSMRAHDGVNSRWSPAFEKSIAELGEEMLKEQAVIDDRESFLRHIFRSDMRPHIARNIRSRLHEEKLRDPVQGLELQQHCMNIRKNIMSMTNARRELAGLRSKVAALIGEEEEVSATRPQSRRSV